ncbi:MAG: UDP-N-acetylmuramoyl-L-alanine--D-glutamate ligase [Clostridia bacterium]|nr:UDP-N-acetylmuramoyl-L-alanine--D-glutamate ligase [Clostridia bacterium]
MQLKNKKVLVYGLGESGRAVIRFLRENHAQVSFYDDNIEFYSYIGFERNPFDKQYDFAVVSPGVKCVGNKLLQHLREKNVLVMSEIDFAYLNCKGKVIGVTGTNGKTTTCMLTYKILKSAGIQTFLCGNIGLPFTAVVKHTTKKSVVVCEVSNFQLELSRFFRPNVACILNVQEDHLDRHGSFAEYKRVKEKIAENMKKSDKLILNLDDEETKYMVVHSNYGYFSKTPLKRGVSVKNGEIYVNKKSVLKIDKIKLRGEKNLENVLASVAICSNFHVRKTAIENAVENFVPASHRMQIIGSFEGVTYVDDSKATNVASTVSCVESFQGAGIVLLMGGRGKQIDYAKLFEKNFQIKEIVCFGEEKDNISSVAESFGYKTTKKDTLRQAVESASKIASAGDFVLLSPACSSFDEFESYADRGEKFKEYVVGIVDGKF